MNILLHTVALEPARWTPQKVSRPLAELLPTIAGAGFYKLEIFEPHLSLLPDEPAMVPLFARHHLVPAVLDSSLELSPHLNPDVAFQAQAEELLDRVDRFGFGKVRLSPGKSPSPEQTPAVIGQVAERLQFLATQRPQVEFLVETQGDSLADDPACAVTLVETAAAPNVGLLWVPTVFEPAAAISQWQAQAPFVRHFHLQNRTLDGRVCRLEAGAVPWSEILAAMAFQIDVTLEFIPSGMCPVEEFDLSTSVQEAVDEFAALVRLET